MLENSNGKEIAVESVLLKCRRSRHSVDIWTVMQYVYNTCSSLRFSELCNLFLCCCCDEDLVSHPC